MATPPSTTRFSLSSSAASDSISKLFEDAARSCLQRTAVQFELSGQVTYRQLLSMVDALASELRGVICKGQSVPVLLSRSVYQVCAILALAKLGAVHVPLELNLPASRLCSILSTTQATVVITEGRFQSLFERFVLVSAIPLNPSEKVDEQKPSCMPPSLRRYGCFTSPGDAGKHDGCSIFRRRALYQPCADINCLSPFDEARISEWSAPSPLPESMESIWLNGGGTLVHQLVESTARKMPLETAVRTLDYALTYSDLMVEATSLCRRLQAVGPIVGTRALIFLSKSVEPVVAELAVLTGGGMFVVLDPVTRVPSTRTSLTRVARG
ncbi:hypothetical protein BKA56DRAFT_681457 [Ilyonectria sp. MPI-CAGE-AT-0026]|nr:hypothetical protein BKA56DRAFT_681457 [Ilyonectria sp. MPI-CAGE-AT-0026]